MRSISIINPGPESQLAIVELETPACNAEQILVRVHASALNRADLMQRQGKYPPPPGESTIPGLEIAGEVVAIGTKVHRFKIGDSVYGLIGSGGYADYCCVHQELAEHIPANLDYQLAAAIPEALTTAHATAFLLGELTEGQRLLIHAAGSGVSSMAIQMARIAKAAVISTASNQDKIDKAKQLGATSVINYKTQDFEEVVGLDSIDVIVDFIGGSYFAKHLQILKPKGRLVQIASMQGHLVDCNLVAIMRKRLQINGFVLRSQSLAEKITLWQSAHLRWSSALRDKQLIPIIDSVFNFKDIEQAQAHMRSGAHFGKIVIAMG